MGGGWGGYSPDREIRQVIFDGLPYGCTSWWLECSFCVFMLGLMLGAMYYWHLYREAHALPRNQFELFLYWNNVVSQCANHLYHHPLLNLIKALILSCVCLQPSFMIAQCPKVIMIINIHCRWGSVHLILTGVSCGLDFPGRAWSLSRTWPSRWQTEYRQHQECL